MQTSLEPVPLVSIGIPVRNGKKHLGEALESALAQEYPELELVISDNASVDRTQSICEDYARRDRRVRYHRNAEDIGAVRNFKRVLELSSGTYFTWLAHDDTLHAPYVSTIVDYMERRPDVVLCGCSMRNHTLEDPEAIQDEVLEAISGDRTWRQARKEFFRWPQRRSHFVIYGLYRRAALLDVPWEARQHKGAPVVMDMEFPILASLCDHGRIVALPDVLRDYRSRADSSACADMACLSRLDFFRLGLQTKRTLLGIAIRSSAPVLEKMELTGIALANFARGQFGRRRDFRESLRTARGEAAMLRRVCAERLEVVNSLDAKVREQSRLIDGLRAELERSKGPGPPYAAREGFSRQGRPRP